MKKFFGLAAAMLAALVMATAFTACGGDDDDDGPSVVAWYHSLSSSSESAYDFVFYSDGTVKFGETWSNSTEIPFRSDGKRYLFRNAQRQ